MSWHIDDSAATRYAERTTDAESVASIEAHVAACPGCATLVSDAAGRTQGDLLQMVWVDIDEALDAPHLGIVERSLRVLRCPESVSRVIAATARAQWSYLAAVVLSIVLASVAARSGRDAAFGVFLVFAPLGPLIATAAAFERWADPVHTLLRTVPTSMWRIALIRTAAAVAPAIVLTAVSALLLRQHGWVAVAWLLPSMALSVGVLALATWIGVERATLILGLVWIAVPVVLRLRVDGIISLMTGPMQYTSIVVIIAAGSVVLTRRTTFDYGGSP